MTKAFILAAVLTLSSAPAEAHHGAPYSANVREARQWARHHTNDRGWRCLDALIHAESGWSVHGVTPSSATPWTGAFGLPQAFPGSKMIRAIGAEHMYSGWRQIRWALKRYIRPRYNSACHARSFQLARGYY